MKAVCTVDGCEKTSITRGYCCAHYERFKRYGSPLGGGTPRGATMKFLNGLVDHSGDDCVTWPYAKDALGRAFMNGRVGTNLAARVMCQMAHGPAPSEKHEAAHSCGNGHEACVNPNHLRWATRAENQADRALHGTSNRGERQGRSKMNEADVVEMRARHQNGERIYDLAAKFGYKEATVEAAINRRSWKWL